MLFREIMKHSLNPKKLFLIDCLGGVLTALLLGLVLATFETTFGMPRGVLYPLSFMAGTYALYSFVCYRVMPKNWQPYLKIIAFANLAYCCLTLGLIFYFYQQLTVLGIIYFLLEVVIIIGLAVMEFRTIAKFR